MDTLSSDVQVITKRYSLAITAVVIAIIIASGALILNNMSQEDPDPEYRDWVELPNGTILYLGDDFRDGTLSAYSKGSDKAVIYLKDEIASGYTKFRWVLKDDLDKTYLSVTKTVPEVTWESPDAGKYTITVYCYAEDSDEPKISFNGSIRCYGNVSKTFSWDFMGKQLSFSLTLSAEELIPFLTDDVQEHLRLQEGCTYVDLIETESTSIVTISEKLMSKYSSSFDPNDRTLYAVFVLDFVQSNFSFAYDSSNYETSDYWAYPTETVYKGCGDDEDSAILYASIMKKSGYNVGILSMPDLTVSMVSVRVTELGEPDEGCSNMYAIRNGETYAAADARFGCDASLGSIDSLYRLSTSGSIVNFNGEECPGYGLVLG